MIVQQRRSHTGHDPDGQPSPLPLQEEIGVAVRIVRVSTRAEKHHHADAYQRRHAEHKKVSTVFAHGSGWERKEVSGAA